MMFPLLDVVISPPLCYDSGQIEIVSRVPLSASTKQWGRDQATPRRTIWPTTYGIKGLR